MYIHKISLNIYLNLSALSPWEFAESPNQFCKCVTWAVFFLEVYKMELRGEATEAYADTAYRYAATHGSKSSVESTYAGAAAFIMEIMRYSKLQHNLYNIIYIIIYLHIVQLYLLKFTHFTNPPGQKWPYFGRVAVSAWIGRGRAWHLPTGWMLSPWKSKVFRRFISKHEDLLELCSFVVQLLQSPAISCI